MNDDDMDWPLPRLVEAGATSRHIDAVALADMLRGIGDRVCVIDARDLSPDVDRMLRSLPEDRLIITPEIDGVDFVHRLMERLDDIEAPVIPFGDRVLEREDISPADIIPDILACAGPPPDRSGYGPPPGRSRGKNRAHKRGRRR